jgi:transposase
MSYELSDYEWTAIKPMLPNKPPSGVPRRGCPKSNGRVGLCDKDDS